MSKPFKTISVVKNCKLSDYSRMAIIGELERLEGERVKVTIEKYKRDSDPQRGYWFGCIVDAYRAHMGHERHEANEVHAHMLYTFLPDLRVDDVNRLTGEIVGSKRVSWTDLDQTQKSNLIEHARRYAAKEWGMNIPDADRYWKMEEVGENG